MLRSTLGFSMVHGTSGLLGTKPTMAAIKLSASPASENDGSPGPNLLLHSCGSNLNSHGTRPHWLFIIQCSICGRPTRLGLQGKGQQKERQ